MRLELELESVIFYRPVGSWKLIPLLEFQAVGVQKSVWRCPWICLEELDEDEVHRDLYALQGSGDAVLGSTGWYVALGFQYEYSSSSSRRIRDGSCLVTGIGYCR